MKSTLTLNANPNLFLKIAGALAPSFSPHPLGRGMRALLPQSGADVVIYQRGADGKLGITRRHKLSSNYTSDFFKSQPDREYTLYLQNCGICNREIPREEKTRLRNLFLDFCNEDFVGLAKIDIFNGEIIHIRIEPK